MRRLIILIIALVFSILESVFLFPLLLIGNIALSSTQNINTSVLFAFIMGFLADVTFTRPLGSTSLFFLAVSFIVLNYKRRFRQENIIFLFISSIIFVNIYLWYFIGGRYLFIIESTVGAILTVLITSFLLYLKEKY